MRPPVALRRVLAEGPAVLAVEPLQPPAVQDRAVHHPVHRRLHPARPRRLERRLGVVEPDIDPVDQVLRRLLAVVLQERDPARELRPARELEDPLQEALALLVGRVGLAGEDELDRPERVRQDPAEPLGIGEDQVRPLVGREPAGKADRQHRRVQEAPLRHQGRGLHRAGGVRMAPQLAHPDEKLVLERDMEVPELAVWDRVDKGPDRLHVVLLLPVRRRLEEVAVVERGDPRVEPGRQVHPVRDRGDGDLVHRPIRPERAEEGSRDLAVPL